MMFRARIDESWEIPAFFQERVYPVRREIIGTTI